jgi:hypothetical protein
MFGKTLNNESLKWRKATYSIGNGDCVEVAPAETTIAVRDSKNTVGPVLCYSARSWQLFLTEARQGNFDDLS